MTDFVNMYFMTDHKREKLLKAAHQLFIRFGYRRTTMGDLAEAAEMSRPALYLLYANKEAIFRAVIVRYFNQAKCLAEQRVIGCSGLADKLAAVMNVWVVDAYIEITRSAEAGEIYEAGHSFAQDVKVEFSDVYTSQILKILTESDEIDTAALKLRGLTLERVANILSCSTTGLKREVQDLEQLKTLLEDIIKIHVLALVNR